MGRGGGEGWGGCCVGGGGRWHHVLNVGVLETRAAGTALSGWDGVRVCRRRAGVSQARWRYGGDTGRPCDRCRCRTPGGRWHHVLSVDEAVSQLLM